ncbi:MAG: sterol desaturase family protein [Terracidiphilus sp.]|jgi:sterol desaturase/sphingolipid hydroxylase (fatty acid hydroxylase superfamily)
MEILESLPQPARQFLLDVLRLSIWFFILAVIFIPLERMFAEKKQKIFRAGLARDIGYYIVNSLLPKALLVVPMAALAWTMHALVPHAVLAAAGHLPLWARAMAALAAGEVGYYWGHRWEHEIPFLWRFHSIHHNAEEMDWLVNSHAHPLDIVFSHFCGFVPMYALGLARPLAGHQVDPVPLIVMLLGIMWGYFIHANINWRFGWLSFLVTTPAFHHWHHTRRDHVDRNYASMLPFVDLIFGSWYMPKKQWPKEYGIDGPVDPGLMGQLLQPFAPVAAAVPHFESAAAVESVQGNL